ncbi:hypothetical protein [uncultured Algibacter sp.]|uniref:hypothetical protein n=1 Tax=uncultured Algibacter sp. TaxID=298659 RepID=UPI00263629A2|nr:hypothetical protein [uncultured Algibacter sp.]
MKNIIKILSLLILVLTMYNCDEENNFKESDINLVPVYSLTEINNDGPFKINIYKEKPLIVEYSSNVTLSNYASSGYADTSTDIMYQITVNKIVDGVAVNYVISADKTTGEGTLNIDSGASTHNVLLTEEEVYN